MFSQAQRKYRGKKCRLPPQLAPTQLTCLLSGSLTGIFSDYKDRSDCENNQKVSNGCYVIYLFGLKRSFSQKRLRSRSLSHYYMQTPDFEKIYINDNINCTQLFFFIINALNRLSVLQSVGLLSRVTLACLPITSLLKTIWLLLAQKSGQCVII